MFARRFLPFLLLVLLGVSWSGLGPLPGPVLAQTDAPRPLTAEQREAESQAAWQAAMEAATRGPATITIRDQATLALPAGMVFIPEGPAARLDRAMGNSVDADTVGMITTTDDSDWIVYVNWDARGYVRDDEQSELDADAILTGMRDATEEDNANRISRGFPAIEVAGWVQAPSYDAANHRLVWSALVRRKEQTSRGSVNFNTRVLGREGYISLNLVTSQASIEQYRPVAAQLLSALDYKSGKRYSDFNASTDKVAEYGLLALIGVVAAKKLGLLALAAAFALKFAKVGILAVGGGLLAVRRLFRRKPTV